jgi:multimeric flavodoxin WrbA
MTFRALALKCSLKPSAAQSSTDKLLDEVLKELAGLDVQGEIVRVVDHKIRPGVKSDEGDGDQWPSLRQKILNSDILVFGTPIWFGQPSSVAKRVLERMDAFLSETDDNQRMPPFGKVAVVAVVGTMRVAYIIAMRRSIKRCAMSAIRSRRRGDVLGRRGDGVHRLQGSQAALR